jgi:carnitine-CoA ligase
VIALETGEEGAEPLARFPGVEPLAAWLDASGPVPDPADVAPSDPLQIVYTSGTTGDPRGVLLANERFMGYAAAGRAVFGYAPDDRLYTGLSLTHGNAQVVTLACALALELPAVLSRRFSKSRLWDVCRRHRCTSFSLLGGMATALYGEPPRSDDAYHDVRTVVSAGMPRALWDAFETRFAVRVLEWYGAVEGGLAFKPIGSGPRGSFGKPAPGLQMKILDEADRECPPGVLGEICSRPLGGQAHVEYYGDPAASAAKTRGGWLRSGDIGHADAEGWLFFDHRKGGALRRNGEFIDPGTVERVLSEHPAVSDVFVYGVPSASGAPGESDLVAAVVPADPSVLPVDSLFAHCAGALVRNSVPSWLQIVTEIPKTASEKPQERFLRERFAPDAPDVHAAPER